jgi:23S rRNA pseudouridine1911/1915/1917 synthase
VRILYEDNHLLAVEKPPGLPTMGTEPGTETLLDRAKAYIADKYQKPGNVYLGIVSRLDAPVTGLVLIARTSKAAARLTEAFSSRNVEKTYLAIVEGEPPEESDTIQHFLRKDERHRKVHVTSGGAEGAQLAVLSYKLLGSSAGLSLVEVKLHTGRKHQIRVQLAKIGCPVLGDQKYGAQRKFPAGIALHSWRLAIEHPVQHTPLALECAPPASWQAFAVARMHLK